MTSLSSQTDRFSHRATSPETHDCNHTTHNWRPLVYFNGYRLIIGTLLLIVTWRFHLTNFGSQHYELFIYTCQSYLLFSSITLLLIKFRYCNFNCHLILQIIGDIVFFSILLYASGGLHSGLGSLLLISLAVSGLISQGRIGLFLAALATISVLLQETYAVLTINSYTPQYSQAGVLCIAYFAIAWLGHELVKRSLLSEQLAQERGIDLANMAEVNKLVIQDLHEGVLVIDKFGYIRQYNTYAEKLLNLAASPPARGTLELSTHLPEIASRLANWQINPASNSELLRLSHSNAVVKTRFLPIQSDPRNGLVIFLEDMGRAQAQLEQLKLAALGRLTANIAHEIRNPLSAINHAAELLQEEQFENNADTRLVRIICDNAIRLNKIVHDVLQLNRRNISKPESIDIMEFFYKFLEGFCHTENIDRDVFVITSSKDLFISFDRDHLNQVIWNLCRNAWRHCRKQAGSIHIEVTTAPTNEHNIVLDIVDDGTGVKPKQIKQLFEPFFTTAPNGTGLGLYIARELCEANQASLEYIAGSSGGHFRIICTGYQPCL
ncbi:two-component sensor histidine kinase [Nitrosomonas sp. JL21]|nr:two-component sensor histidine kinase [Nitrosomonas sp.]MCC7090822.1 two-component sensor histidine kinase [Nitrosomonas sp.]MXS78738.1 two-component sensor histidine kinase [Nitrosomonas sp. JL21]